jgi:hypothetical protein
VRCAAFPELISHGDTPEKGRAMAREALELCLEVYRDEGRPIPAPAALVELLAWTIPCRRAKWAIEAARAQECIMPDVRDPRLDPVPIAELRPTQITVGMREVAAKRENWRSKGAKAEKFLGKHMIPVIIGPNKHHYVIDHHHLALALHEEGVANVLVNAVADLSALGKDAFWFTLDNRNWMHPFDDRGKRRPYEEIPKSVTGLVDDPFRSLAGELRRVGGYAKDTTPFSEFLWADFLRRRLKRKDVEKDFDSALAEALEMAKTKDAAYLPGWCGPVPRD